MKEKQIQNEIRFSAERQGIWYYKFPDSPVSWSSEGEAEPSGCDEDRRQTAPVVSSSASGQNTLRFTLPKPCDFIMVLPSGRVIFGELKVARKGVLPFSCLRESQVETAEWMMQHGVDFYIFIYWQEEKILAWISYGRWKHIAELMTRKSLPFANPIMIPLQPYKANQKRGKRGLPVGGRRAWRLSDLP